MSGRPARRREWRIGDLAAATGLSVRALRHYEQIGLLPPPHRSEAGHRIYDEQDVARLYRICALRSLGMPLTQIAEALEQTTLDEILHRHLDHLEQEALRVAGLRDRLRRLVAHLDEPVPVGRLVALIEAMTQMERYFTPKQLNRLAARRTTIGAEGAREYERIWRELGIHLRRQPEVGAAPSSPGVRPLAQRARGYIDAFTGDDPAMQRALAHLRELPLPDDLAGWNAELLDYLYQALEALPPAEDGRVC